MNGILSSRLYLKKINNEKESNETGRGERARIHSRIAIVTLLLFSLSLLVIENSVIVQISNFLRIHRKCWFFFLGPFDDVF